jgi:hypothetical protein
MLAAIGGVISLLSIYLGFYKYLEYASQSSNTLFDFIVGGLFVFTSFVSIVKFYYKLNHQIPYTDSRLRFILGFMRLILNIKISQDLSFQEKKVKSINKVKIREWPPFKMTHKPNFFFLFIESYGSILLQHEEMQSSFKDIFERFEMTLSKNNWKIISNLSMAPSASAFSWLCYSTFIYGYKIHQHAHYQRFIKNPLFYNSDNLMRILKNQGYRTYFLNPIQSNNKIKVDYNYLTPFYGIDNWILLDDLHYTGDRYGFGDCPPDQFSINQGREIIEKNEDPYALMFLTKNSHSPFTSPQSLSKSWQSLNKKGGRSNYGGGFLSRPTTHDYLNAINYQLENLGDFIVNTAKEDDIYVVIGDHQPPVLNNSKIYGLNTPIHLVSRNTNFLQGFKEYGFRNSLWNDTLIPQRHESMYSALLREIMKNFGSGYYRIPDYEPFGIQI